MHLVHAVFSNYICFAYGDFIAILFDVSGHLGFFAAGMIIVYLNLKLNLGVVVVLIKVGSDKEVSQADLRLGKEVNLSVNAAKQPHILILDVLCVTVTVNLCGNAVFAGNKIFCYVKLVRSHSAL